MVRCFVGIMLPEGLKDYVRSIQFELKKVKMDCKFVESENLHLNFSFLGEIGGDEIEGVKTAIDSIDFGIFEVEIDEIKLIPSENYFHVVVLDVKDGSGKLSLLMKNIVETIGGDFKPPHLTLCRVKNVSDKTSVVKKIREIKTEERKLLIDMIQLIKSELGESGPVYKILHEKKFAS